MSFGDLFWTLAWLATWASVIGSAAVGIVLIRRRGEDTEFLWYGIGALACALFLGLAAAAVATGEWNLSSFRLLPDGCYRVGHEFSGKTTHNTFELIEACR